MRQQSPSLLLQASNTSKAQAKAGQKKPAAASRKRQPVVLSDSAGSEEEEQQDSSSEDETERLEIERVLDGRPDANSKQEEFLVKFKGNTPSLHAFLPQADFYRHPSLQAYSFYAPSLHASYPSVVLAERAILAAYEQVMADPSSLSACILLYCAH